MKIEFKKAKQGTLLDKFNCKYFWHIRIGKIEFAIYIWK